MSKDNTFTIQKIAKTAPDALKVLWREKILFKRKTFSEIKSELEKRGYNFTDHNLGMALKDAKFLTKHGKRGNFTYVQRHPFVERDNSDNQHKNK